MFINELIGAGSYPPDDVTFLLQRIEPRFVSIEEKERLIQSGTHYGQLLSPEQPPENIYQQLYQIALHRHAQRLCDEILRLAQHIHSTKPQAVLVSLARAGTPIGVLLKRTLTLIGQNPPHYSVSIIRDHGIDKTAIEYIAARHDPNQVVFIDGWTGKGVISRELASSVQAFNQIHHTAFDASLHVLADPGGHAAISATPDDYLIPNAMLNATISGLISRTILTEHGYHGAALLEHLQPFDHSQTFIQAIMAHIQARLEHHQDRQHDQSFEVAPPTARRKRTNAYLESLQHRFGPRPINHIKPGIGETTRVMLRRMPEILLLQTEDHPDTAHLVTLARTRDVRIELEPDMPYRATALIRSIERDP
jgi:Phosphoribosyl transferase (PRTase)/PELOTA RNA binding domain